MISIHYQNGGSKENQGNQIVPSNQRRSPNQRYQENAHPTPQYSHVDTNEINSEWHG
jgi:hypothetical protein